MSSLLIAAIVFIVVFVGAMFGQWLSLHLPERHRSPETHDAIKLTASKRNGRRICAATPPSASCFGTGGRRVAGRGDPFSSSRRKPGSIPAMGTGLRRCDKI